MLDIFEQFILYNKWYWAFDNSYRIVGAGKFDEKTGEFIMDKESYNKFSFKYLPFSEYQSGLVLSKSF